MPEKARKQRNERERQKRRRQRRQINRADVVEQLANARPAAKAQKSEAKSKTNQCKALAKHEPKDVGRRPERESDSQFARPLRDTQRHDAVESDAGEDQCQPREAASKTMVKRRAARLFATFSSIVVTWPIG